MKQIIFTASFVTFMALITGCDTALEGSYKPYTPESPAAVLWPSPESTEAQPASYQETPTTVPTTMPGDRGD